MRENHWRVFSKCSSCWTGRLSRRFFVDRDSWSGPPKSLPLHPAEFLSECPPFRSLSGHLPPFCRQTSMVHGGELIVRDWITIEVNRFWLACHCPASYQQAFVKTFAFCTLTICSEKNRKIFLLIVRVQVPCPKDKFLASHDCSLNHGIDYEYSGLWFQ